MTKTGGYSRTYTVDAAMAAVLSELNNISSLKDGQGMAGFSV